MKYSLLLLLTLCLWIASCGGDNGSAKEPTGYATSTFEIKDGLLYQTIRGETTSDSLKGGVILVKGEHGVEMHPSGSIAISDTIRLGGTFPADKVVVEELEGSMVCVRFSNLDHRACCDLSTCKGFSITEKDGLIGVWFPHFCKTIR